MKYKTLSTIPIIFLLVLSLAPTTAQAQKVAFMTSVTGPGDLSSWPDALAVGAVGVDAGDAVCQARALAAGLANPQDFVAWLSDNNVDAYCRIHGFAGTIVANCGQAKKKGTVFFS
jgi:hypothetical protein